MQLRKVNAITFVADKISDAELGHFIKLLCEHDYDISIKYDGCCIVVEYDDAAHQHFGNPINVWVDPEELEEVLADGEYGTYDIDEDDDEDDDDEYYDEDDEEDDDFDDFGDPDFDDDFRD